MDKNTFPITTLWWTGSLFQNVQSCDLLMIVLDERENKRAIRKKSKHNEKDPAQCSLMDSEYIPISIKRVSKKCPKSVTRTWVCWYIPHWKIRKRELNIYVRPQVNSSGSWTPEMARLLSSRFESGGGMDSSPQLKEKCTLKPCKTRHTLLSPETILN